MIPHVKSFLGQAPVLKVITSCGLDDVRKSTARDAHLTNCGFVQHASLNESVKILIATNCFNGTTVKYTARIRTICDKTSPYPYAAGAKHESPCDWSVAMVKRANEYRPWRAYSVGLVVSMAFSVGLATQSPSRVRFVPAGPALAKDPLKFTVTGSGLDAKSTEVTFTGGGCSKPCVAELGALVKGQGTEAALTGQMTLNAGRYTVAIVSRGQTVATDSINVAPGLVRIWVDPITPGEPFSIAIQARGINRPTTEARISGNGCPPPRGCPVTLERLDRGEDVESNFLIGTAKVPRSGKYEFTVIDAMIASKPLSLAIPEPRVDLVRTEPSPPVPGQPFKFEMVGEGFYKNEKTLNVLRGSASCPPAACRFDLDPSTSRTVVSGRGMLQATGRYHVWLGPAGQGPPADPKSLEVPPKIEKVSTIPEPPVARQQFQLTISGQGFGYASRLVATHKTACPKGCSYSLTWTGRELTGRMTPYAPGEWQLQVTDGSGRDQLASTPTTVTVRATPPTGR